MKARRLDELDAIRQALRQRRREAAEVAARASERQAQQLRERNLFALTVGGVVPLRPVTTAPQRPSPVTPVARQRERDEAAVMHEAISDEFDVESLLETDDALSFRRPGIGPEVVRKLRRGVWTIQAQLDLHGARRDEAREMLNRFVFESKRSGMRCVRVIHGKGNGSPGREPVLKGKVMSWLVQKKDVIAFTQARGCDGGAGAVLVLFAPAAPRPARCGAP
ncbi:MAG: Smr/MutS family protein [Burkholderiaceae bacterium]